MDSGPEHSCSCLNTKYMDIDYKIILTILGENVVYKSLFTTTSSNNGGILCSLFIIAQLMNNSIQIDHFEKGLGLILLILPKRKLTR